MSKPVTMSDKVELTALQLVYLLDNAICEAITRLENDECFDTLTVAQSCAVMYVATHRKEGE